MRYLVVHRSSQRLDGHLPQVALGMTPYRDRPVGLFLFAHHNHEGDLLHLGIADLLADLLAAVIHFDPNVLGIEASATCLA